MRSLLILTLILVFMTFPLTAQTSERYQREVHGTQERIRQLEAELKQQQQYLEDLNASNAAGKSTSQQDAQMESMQQQVRDLTVMVTELSRAVATMAIQEDTTTATTDQTSEEHTVNKGIYTTADSLELVKIRRKQAESRRQIDIITMELLQISEQLKDPDRRYALARKLQEDPGSPDSTPEKVTGSTDIAIDVITARSIDLAAVELVRKGQALDQARMSIIDGLKDGQVREYYKSLSKDDRYYLYDIADEIQATEDVDLDQARKSALFFYFYVP